MIGNISFATNPNELTFILQTRMNTKVAAYKSRGIDAPKCKVISIDDFCPRGIEDFLCASILLPPPRAMDYLIDGNYDQFYYLYKAKLTEDKDVVEYIIALVAGLMEKSWDYILYFDFDNNSNMGTIVTFLFNYLRLAFGLVFYSALDIQNNPNALYNQSVMPEFMMNNLNILYDNGYAQIIQESVFHQF